MERYEKIILGILLVGSIFLLLNYLGVIDLSKILGLVPSGFPEPSGSVGGGGGLA